jgi:hypothetical protein
MVQSFVAEDGTPYKVVEPGSPEDTLPNVGEGGAGSAPQVSSKEPAPLETPATQPAAGEGTSPATGAGAGAASPPPQATPEEEAEALRKLDGFLEEQLKATAEETRRGMQKLYDPKIDKLTKDIEAASAREKQFREEIRQLQLQGVDEDQKSKLKAVWEQEDKKSELDTYAKQLEDYHRDLMVATMIKDYSDYGVEEKDLGGLTLEEMQIFCAEAKAAYFEELSKKGPPPLTAPPPIVQQGAPAPAGVNARSDVGGGGGANPPVKLSEEQSPRAMAENLAKLPWETISIKR